MTLEALLQIKAAIEKKLMWTNGEQRAELTEQLEDLNKKIEALSN